MTPNTLRIALGLLLFGTAPLAVTAFPQQAISDTHMSQVEEPAAEEPAVEEPMVEDPTAEDPAAAEEPMATTEQSIAEIAAGDENFEILTAAIEAAGLTEALNNADLSVTVFAPTDEAFEALPEGTLETLLLPENRDQLAQILSYHVLDGEVLSTDLASGEVDTLAGAPVMVMVGEEAVTINEANVVATDIEASNGVIHVIDSVLLPM
ncbi:fasciclin domain-containing protein [Nodosilinea sp. AN01ver1]|uniref:fasciclin domain-containing protein n=1 Tax=Nodosilinea sp. AN01ver1 TaxID=3423362 RepID=UPI003D312588